MGISVFTELCSHYYWLILEKFHYLTLESPLDSKEIKPVNPKEINSEYSLEGLMVKLKLQSFGHLMQRAIPLEKTLMLGKTEGRGRRGPQRIRWLDGITDSTDKRVWTNSERHWRTRGCAAVHGVAKSQTWLSNRTTTTNSSTAFSIFILLYNHHHHPYPELFTFCKTETLITLSTPFFL